MARYNIELSGRHDDDDDGLKKRREDKSMDQDGSSNKETSRWIRMDLVTEKLSPFSKKRCDDRNDIDKTLNGAVSCFAK